MASASIVLVILVLEISAHVGLVVLRSRRGIPREPAYSGRLSPAQQEIIRSRVLDDRSSYVMYDAALGWTIRPNGQGDLYVANSAGLRSVREYARVPSPGVLRVAVFGDSYTHGDDVRNEETWAERLSESGAHLEVLNFGVGGFGTDQALLRFEREGIGFSPRVALLGVRPENIQRVVSVFRPFYAPRTGLPMSKPRFDVVSGELRLLPNPLASREAYEALLTEPFATARRLGAHDGHYSRHLHRHWADRSATIRLLRLALHETHAALRPNPAPAVVDSTSEAYAVLTSLLRRFHRHATERGIVPIVVMLPDRDDTAVYLRDGVKGYGPVLRFLRTEGIDVIDVMDAFESLDRDSVSQLFASHYTPFGNVIVGRFIHEQLRSRTLLR